MTDEDGHDATKEPDYWHHIMKHGDQDHVCMGPIVERTPDGRLIERDARTGKIIKERRDPHCCHKATDKARQIV